MSRHEIDSSSQRFSGHISRREFARLTAAAAIASLLESGCREIGSRATTLRFWNGFTGPDGPYMLKMVKAFNHSQDDVQVVMQRMDWGTYYNKLFVAGLGGRSPETFVVHTESLGRFLYADLLAPVDSIFKTGISPDEIDENVLAAAQRNGVTYALPLDVHPCGVYYNQQLFADAGIAKPPTNRAEFLDALVKLRKGGDGGLSQWGFVYEWLRVNLWTLQRQWGGKIIGDDGVSVVLDSPESRAALEFAASLINELKLVPEIQNMNAFNGFRQGRIGMVWAGVFMVQEALKQKDLKFGASIVPLVGERPATWGGSHNLCMRPGLDERQRSGAERFFRFLSDHTLDWAEAGQVPVRKKLREDPRFKALPVQPVFAEQIPYVQYMPATPYTVEYQGEYDVCCEAVLRATKTPTEALKEAQRKIELVAARFATQKPAGGAA